MFVANCIKNEIEEMFERIDENGDGRVGFEEFARLMLELDHAKPRQALRLSFEAIDKDHDGAVSFAEFRDWVSR